MKLSRLMGQHLLLVLTVAATTATAQNSGPLTITLINDSEAVFADYSEERNLGFRLGLEYITQDSGQLAGRDVDLSEITLPASVWEANQLPAQDQLPPGDIWIAPVQARKAHRMIQYATATDRLLLVPATASDDLPVADHPSVFRTFYRWQDVEQALADWVPVANPIWVTAVNSGATLPSGSDRIQVSPRSSGAAALRDVQDLAQRQQEPIVVSSWPVALEWLTAPSANEFSLPAARYYAWLPDLAALSALRDMPGLNGLTYYYYDLPLNPVNDWLVSTMLDRHDRLPSHYVVAGMNAALALAAGLEASAGGALSDLQAALPGLSWQGVQSELTFTSDGETEQTLFRTRLRHQPQLNWARPVRVD